MNHTPKSLLIFGTGKIAHAVTYYFNRDSEYTIEAYVVDDAYVKDDTFLDKPIIRLSEVADKYSTDTHSVFVAVGYQGMNKLRREKYAYFKEKRYPLASYKSPYVHGEFTMGENTIVMDGAIIQPFASFGNNVFVWGGAMVGHHARIHDHCWITGGCLIGGSVDMGSATFIGMGAIVGQEVKTGIECMLGAGSLTVRSIGDKAVVMQNQTESHRLNSEQFSRMSVCFRT